MSENQNKETEEKIEDRRLWYNIERLMLEMKYMPFSVLESSTTLENLKKLKTILDERLEEIKQLRG